MLRTGIFILTFLLNQASSLNATAATKAIELGRLWDGHRVIANAVVIVENDKVQSVTAGGEIPAGAEVIDLRGYTGMLNLETIDGRIIEGHLRFTDQWPDLYGEGWLDALVGLYAGGTWNFADRDRRLGYSVVLFGPHDRSYRQPSKNLLERLRRRAEVSSIQITFDETRSASSHAMPPGGFRLAVINSRDLVASLDVRMDLRRYFALEPVLEGV